MWAAPAPQGVGPRSGGPKPGDQRLASGVTAGEAALQTKPAGAAFALGGSLGQAEPAPESVPPAKPSVIKGASAIEDNAVARGESILRSSPASGAAQGRPTAGHELEDEEREYVFEIIRRARKLLADEEAARAIRGDTDPSPDTVTDYERKCAVVDEKARALGEPEGHPYEIVLAAYAPKKQTFFAMKAALKWRALKAVRALLARQDACQRARDFSIEWWETINKLRTTTQDMALLSSLERATLLDVFDRHGKPATSKRDQLGSLPDGWQARFIDANRRSSKYRLAGTVLRFTGLRPRELANGVELRAEGHRIHVHITGAKVRQATGQPWRVIALARDLLPSWFVDEVDGAGAVVVQVEPDALRKHLARLSAEVLGPRSKQVRLSAYLFRHALVTDLREEGWSSDEIASAIGESAAETVSWYGIRSRAISQRPRHVAIVRSGVEAARAVRPVDLAKLRAVTTGRKSLRKNAK